MLDPLRLDLIIIIQLLRLECCKRKPEPEASEPQPGLTFLQDIEPKHTLKNTWQQIRDKSGNVL